MCIEIDLDDFQYNSHPISPRELFPCILDQTMIQEAILTIQQSVTSSLNDQTIGVLLAMHRISEVTFSYERTNADQSANKVEATVKLNPPPQDDKNNQTQQKQDKNKTNSSSLPNTPQKSPPAKTKQLPDCFA